MFANAQNYRSTCDLSRALKLGPIMIDDFNADA
jgi:hypothetical protein